MLVKRKPGGFSRLNATSYRKGCTAGVSLIAGFFLVSTAFAQTIVYSGSQRLKVNTTWSSGNTYLLQGELEVMNGVTLTVEDGANVLIQNGLLKGHSLTERATLIFRTGSSLKANHLLIQACDSQGNPIQIADNGGVVFIGNGRKAQKGKLVSDIAPGYRASSFQADTIETRYLGADDRYIYPYGVRKPIREVDDWDAISFLGLSPQEWAVPHLISMHSGQNGIDAVNSSLTLASLDVTDSVEDGVNLQSSQVTVEQVLKVITDVNRWDVNLFDFEAVNGYSSLTMKPGINVKLDGVFGAPLILRSSEMPSPGIAADKVRYTCCASPLKDVATVFRY